MHNNVNCSGKDSIDISRHQPSMWIGSTFSKLNLYIIIINKAFIQCPNSRPLGIGKPSAFIEVPSSRFPFQVKNEYLWSTMNHYMESSEVRYFDPLLEFYEIGAYMASYVFSSESVKEYARGLKNWKWGFACSVLVHCIQMHEAWHFWEIWNR